MVDELAADARGPQADFSTAPRAVVDVLAHRLLAVLAALRAELADPAYNLILRTAPTGYEESLFLVWSLQLFARLEIAAGLELATASPSSPSHRKTAAARLRNRMYPTVTS
ncbi:MULTISPECIES: hypothetical protein [unclassified Amycolatopsis]|uniref:hypothetical protein n=1 Tax=unclassified Amycolatopsis TaxID=2618356 RepID=UPI001C6A5643|nr:hypothetical protein [Amycolatopsis sp. DSM 110486]QYN20282.1 hypothetical protein K1T34_48465 [Amycolatopsis sp. DSM 110486]